MYPVQCVSHIIEPDYSFATSLQAIEPDKRDGIFYAVTNDVDGYLLGFVSSSSSSKHTKSGIGLGESFPRLKQNCQ